MAHEIIVDTDARVLRVRYMGQIGLDERRRIADEALDTAGAAGLHRILLDFRDAHALATDALAADRMVARLAPRIACARVAYLVKYDHQVSDVLEELARQRGIAVARFHDLGDAMEWLGGTGPDPETGDAASPATHDAPATRALARGDSDVLRLVTRVLDPEVPVPPATYTAIGQLVQELLDAGVPEPEVLKAAMRMSAAIQQVVKGPT